MNRILFSPGETAGGSATVEDARAEHILGVLHGEVGDTLKTGELDGPIGTGTIVAIDGAKVTLRLDHTQASLEPWVDLILAPPRPRVLKRLLPQLAAMGAGQIVLVGAKKVEKDFWGATLLKEEIYRPLLVDGLMQAGTSIMPQILPRRNFRAFVRDEMDGLFPHSRRIVAHPYAKESPQGPDPDGKGAISCTPDPAARLLLAVGPEGGWTDDEVEMLEAKGFSRYSLGGRILRTDTALIALLARLG